MQIISCDLCGKELSKHCSTHKEITVTTIAGEHDVRTVSYYDLCEECYAAITNRKRKEVENEKRWIGIYNATFFLWGV